VLTAVERSRHYSQPSRDGPVLAGQEFAALLGAAFAALISVMRNDVSGRWVVSRDVGSSGLGWHTLRLGDLPAGLYIVRLSQAGRSLSSRVAVLR
jgi:hypothetical protein